MQQPNPFYPVTVPDNKNSPLTTVIGRITNKIIILRDKIESSMIWGLVWLKMPLTDTMYAFLLMVKRVVEKRTQ